MFATYAIDAPSGDHVGCAAFAAGSGTPAVGTAAPVCGSINWNCVPKLMSRRDASGLNVENSDWYDVAVTGASVGAGLPALTAGSLRSNAAPLSPPPHSSPAR